MPSPAQLQQFYSVFHRTSAEGGWYDEIEARMQVDFPTKLRLVQQRLEAGRGRLLDVGCGKGHFVRACVNQGIDAQGVDLSDSAVEYAVAKLGVKAQCGALCEIKDKLGLFDVITLWATIEHLPEPARMLADIFSLLKPGGHLFLDTGIGHDWLDRMLPGVVQWYDPPQHLFVFSSKGLRKMLQSADFSIIRLDECFERSSFRRALRVVQNGAVALGLCAVAAYGRLNHADFHFTRFPIANLMMVIARKPQARLP